MNTKSNHFWSDIEFNSINFGAWHTFPPPAQPRATRRLRGLCTPEQNDRNVSCWEGWPPARLRQHVIAKERRRFDRLSNRSEQLRQFIHTPVIPPTFYEENDWINSEIQFKPKLRYSKSLIKISRWEMQFLKEFHRSLALLIVWGIILLIAFPGFTCQVYGLPDALFGPI